MLMTSPAQNHLPADAASEAGRSNEAFIFRSSLRARFCARFARCSSSLRFRPDRLCPPAAAPALVAGAAFFTFRFAAPLILGYATAATAFLALVLLPLLSRAASSASLRGLVASAARNAVSLSANRMSLACSELCVSVCRVVDVGTASQIDAGRSVGQVGWRSGRLGPLDGTRPPQLVRGTSVSPSRRPSP